MDSILNDKFILTGASSIHLDQSGTDPAYQTDSMPGQKMSVVWDWRYGVTDTKINALYKKAVAEQWQADSLNWGYTIDPPRDLRGQGRNSHLDASFLLPLSGSQREEFVSLSMADSLSQILHGEQGGMLVSCRLAQVIPERDAKSFAISQAMDEARHIDVFSRYARRLHTITPPTETLTRILDKVMTTPHWQSMLIGVNIMVEGLALATFASIRNTTSCALLRELLKMVMRDESRHVAFGNLYLKKILADMHPDDRAEVEDFAADLVAEYRQWGHQAGDWHNTIANLIKIGVDPHDYFATLRAIFAHSGTVDIEPKMLNGLDSFVMPTLERIGLISDRVRPRYRDSEIETSRDLKALEELERSFFT